MEREGGNDIDLNGDRYMRYQIVARSWMSILT